MMSIRTFLESWLPSTNDTIVHHTRLDRYEEDVERDVRIKSRIDRYNFDPLHTKKIHIGNLKAEEADESEEEE